MTEEITKCVKGESCIHCGSTYCRFVDEVDELEQENKELNFKINQLKANGLYNDLTGIELSAKVVELEQENKELKDNDCEKCKHLDLYMKYKSALEEIRTYLDTLSSIDSDFTSTETYLRIQDKINEVLNLS